MSNIDYSKYKGKIFDNALKSELVMLHPENIDICVLVPGSIVTADYRPDRIRCYVNNLIDMEILGIRVG